MEFDILRFEEGGWRRVRDVVVREGRVRIFLNGEEVGSIPCLPKDLEYLGVGYLFSKGLISEAEDVSVGRGVIRVRGRKGRRRRRGKAPPISPEGILKLVEEFERRARLYRLTGGTHMAALSDGEKIIFCAEDVGRGSAIDKVIGKSILSGTDMGDKILITSGRVTSETMEKVIRAGIPFVISISAPTDKAVRMARRRNIILAGFVRGKRINLYSFPTTLITES